MANRLVDKEIAKFNAADMVRVEIAGELNARGHLEVEVASQITPPTILSFSTEVNGEVALTVSAAAGDYVVNVSSVTDVVVGNHLVLTDNTNYRFYVGKILAINTLAVTVDSPVSAPFTIAESVVTFTSVAMNVDGSTTPVVFGARTGEAASAPLTALVIDLNRVLMGMITSSPVSLELFGNLTALTRGCLLRINNGDGTYTNLFNYSTANRR